jgi:hypothetical protein
MLVGLVKKNGIMMIDFAIEAQRERQDAARAIYEACLVRFRPIMMTTMAALVGTLPIALGWGRRRRVAPAARPRGRRRPARLAAADALHHAGLLHLHLLGSGDPNRYPISQWRLWKAKMPSYDDRLFAPPAAVLNARLRNPQNGAIIPDVLFLIDTGADVTLLPLGAVNAAEIEQTGASYELLAFDGRSSAVGRGSR